MGSAQARDFGGFYYPHGYYYVPRPGRAEPTFEGRSRFDDSPYADRLKSQTAEQLKRAPKPPPAKGPLLIAISLIHQRLTLYDDGVAIATSPISTGTAQRPTPTGVFAVIQKQRWHRSNLYSDAPMPFMQRITWSGVALHAGHLPGYPASHGCVRLPNDFAIKLWQTTQTGVRVIIAQNDLAPVDITHPKLFVPRPKPAPTPAPVAVSPPAPDPGRAVAVAPGAGASPAAVTDPGKQKSTERPAEAQPAAALPPATAQQGAPAAAPPAQAAPAASDTPHEQTTEQQAETTIASAANPGDQHDAGTLAAQSSVVAQAFGNGAQAPTTERSGAATAEASSGNATGDKQADEKSKSPSAAAAGAGENANKPAAVVILRNGQPPELTEAPSMLHMPSQLGAAPAPWPTPTATGEAVRQTTTASPTAQPAPTESKPPELRLSETKPAEPKLAAAASINSSIAVAVIGSVTAPPPVVEQPLRPGPVSVFVSRKERRVFVRKGFQPVFDMPIVIKDQERPLGTHVFTALKAKDGGTNLRWMVVSVPNEQALAEHSAEAQTLRRNKKAAPAALVHPPVAATAALDRIELPADAVERISELTTAGASLIITDEGLGPETGTETDFVVLTSPMEAPKRARPSRSYDGGFRSFRRFY